uniref:Uncharacterized protein n=1 Tax=Brassica oleracea var. oleracea TaxID=109376 RepID=A0A0D3ARR8_BRAOL
PPPEPANSARRSRLDLQRIRPSKINKGLDRCARSKLFNSFHDVTMASSSSSDTWMREYNEALKLSEDINGMMSERNSSALTGPDAQRRASAIRRKITILGTRLDSLQSLLVKVPGKQHVSEKEMNRRKDMVGNLRSKANQVASALNMSNFANRDSLLGPDTKPDDAINRVSGMDNQGIVGFQRQTMRGKL